jgi:glycosyltransferase involved in cell wall biosynthesis
MSLPKDWATECRHPTPTALFALPNAIYFLLKFRSDLASFEHRTIEGRITLYFWWKAYGERDYSDFEWVLGKSEVAYLKQLDAEALIDRYPRAISFWLAGNESDILDDKGLLEVLLKSDLEIGTTRAWLPRFTTLLVNARADLLTHIELGTFSGQLAALTWWETHGQFEYPRLSWSPNPVWDQLNELGSEQKATLIDIPAFLELLVNSRHDLRANLDMTTFAGRFGALIWWDENGKLEYPRLGWQTSPIIHKLNQIVPEENETLIGIPAFLKLLVNSRDDLRANLDMTTFAGRFGALIWWDENGKLEYPRLVWQTSLIIHQLNQIVPEEKGTLIGIPAFLKLLVNSRHDLRANLDMTTFAGRFGALIWWDENGKLEYPRLDWQTSPIIHQLSQIVPDENGTLIDIPRFLAPLVNSRRDLSDGIDLDSFHGRFSMLLWWDVHGKREYRRLDWPTAKIFDRLNELDDGDQRGLFRVPHFLPLLIGSRSDMQSLFDFDTFRGRLSAMQWWIGSGQREYPSLQWKLRDSLNDLMRMDSPPPAAMALPRLLLLIRESRPDLIAAFDIGTTQGALALITWWHTSGRNKYPEFRQLRLLPAEIREQAFNAIRNDQSSTLVRPFGVNIVGFPQGVLGLGEDARMATQAMQLGGFDVALINAPMSGPARFDTSVNHLLRDDLVYQVSLFCLPPPEMVRLTLEGGRRLIESDTYKIGAWPWELPRWPSAFGQASVFVDEIWAQSRFVEAVYARLGQVKVRHMPMAVVVPTPQAIDRKAFGLPADDFLFYLMFDGNSWLTRKNPVAGIMAFKQAFAKDASGVGLVIKAMNARDDDPTWRQVCELASADDRIHIVSERLDRQDTINFMACCDAYISLHRSEGFGRVIAEAMALGQPVVATNFSGNADFCDEQTAFLVDGDLVPLRPGDYLFHEGQYWCDPDVEMAASQLVRVFGDANLRERIAKAGRARIERDYSMAAVARAYAQRLDEIRKAAGR